MMIGNDNVIRAFLADEARHAVTAAPSLDEAVGRLASRIGERPSGASQRLIVLLAATLLLVAALGTAIAVGSGILRLPLVIDDPQIEPMPELGIFEPVAGRIVYRRLQPLGRRPGRAGGSCDEGRADLRGKHPARLVERRHPAPHDAAESRRRASVRPAR